MKETVVYTMSNGNVFADLGLDNAEDYQEKADLIATMLKGLRERELTQKEVGEMMDVPPSVVTDLLCGKWDLFPMDRLRTCSRALKHLQS